MVVDAQRSPNPLCGQNIFLCYTCPLLCVRHVELRTKYFILVLLKLLCMRCGALPSGLSIMETVTSQISRFCLYLTYDRWTSTC